MKKSIFIAFLSITITAANAQNNRNNTISFATTLGTGISIDTPSTTPLTWQVLGYYHLTERWSVGIGTGLSFYEKMLIPAYGDIKFQLKKKRKFTPYAECAIGYSFAPNSHANGGFLLNPSIGIQYPLKNKMKLQLAVGYEFQELERLKKHTDSHFEKEFVEELSHHTISIKLGWHF